jgi:hypothetical protein
MRFSLKLAAALPVLLGAPAAMAQNMPPAFPTKDVTVTYKTQGGPEMQMSWLVAEQRVRIDMTGGSGAMLMDVRGRKGFMLMDEQKMAMELPQDAMPAPAGQIPDGAKVTKGSTETVAGLTCTVWLTEYQGGKSRSCVTSDGVMLAAGADGAPAAIEATKVTYSAQDAKKFQVPEGYQLMQMPGQGSGAPAAR